MEALLYFYIHLLECSFNVSKNLAPTYKCVNESLRFETVSTSQLQIKIIIANMLKNFHLYENCKVSLLNYCSYLISISDCSCFRKHGLVLRKSSIKHALAQWLYFSRPIIQSKEPYRKFTISFVQFIWHHHFVLLLFPRFLISIKYITKARYRMYRLK